LAHSVEVTMGYALFNSLVAMHCTRQEPYGITCFMSRVRRRLISSILVCGSYMQWCTVFAR